MTQPRNLLIVRTDRIGDVVLSLPLAGEVKRFYPDCRVSFLVREYTRPLVQDNPYIDEILVLQTKDSKPALRENIKLLMSRNFDTVIIVYPTFIISLLIFLSGISNRIGTGYRWYSVLFNNKVYEHRKSAEKHELEYNFSMLRNIGISSVPHKGQVNFSMAVNPEAADKVACVLIDEGLNQDEKTVIVHPGSGGSAVDLSAGKMKELVTLISEKTVCNILLTGSSSEVDLCAGIKGISRAINLAGKFNLTELICLIDRCSLFISNSTGPLHIAAALNKPVIGFYPKVIACSAKRWGPYSDKGLVFTPELECDNCTVEQCIKLNCMNYINIDKVFEKTEKILKLLPNTGEPDVL